MGRFVWVALVATAAFAAGSGCGNPPAGSGPKAFRMAMMPKLTGIAYFNACERGAREAALELGIDFTYNGPPQDDVRPQIRMLEQWIASGFDCIAVAPNNPASISPVLKEARASIANGKCSRSKLSRSLVPKLLFGNACCRNSVSAAMQPVCERSADPCRPQGDALGKPSFQNCVPKRSLGTRGICNLQLSSQWLASGEHIFQQLTPTYQREDLPG